MKLRAQRALRLMPICLAAIALPSCGSRPAPIPVAPARSICADTPKVPDFLRTRPAVPSFLSASPTP